MFPYLLVLSFIMCWVILEKKVLNRKSFWLPLLMLALFAGIRSYQVGTDSGNYVKYFFEGYNVNSFNFRDGLEFGYQLFEYILLLFTKNYFWLFFISGLIVVYCYLKVIKQYSVNYGLSIYFFITFGAYTFFFNGLRQGIAMAIFVISTQYLVEKRLIPYLLICLFASFFHGTALFMIPFYFIVNLNLKPVYKILLTFIGSLFVSRPLVFYIASTNEKYESYAQLSETSGGLLTLGFYTSLVILIYIISYIYKIKEEVFIKLYTFYAAGTVFIIPLAILGSDPSGPQRLLSYFTWALILLLPIVLRKINNFYITALTVIISLIYFILTTTRFSNLTPYIINPIFEIL